MAVLRAVIVFIVVIIILSFSLLNSSFYVNINLFGKIYTTRLVFLMFYAFIFGFAALFIFSIVREIELHSRLRKKEKENRQLLEELTELRNLPLGIEEEEKPKKRKAK